VPFAGVSTTQRPRAAFIAAAALTVIALITVDFALPAIHRAHERQEAKAGAHREAVYDAQVATARTLAGRIELPSSFAPIKPVAWPASRGTGCDPVSDRLGECWHFAGTPASALPLVLTAVRAAGLNPPQPQCHRSGSVPGVRGRLLPAHTGCLILADNQLIALDVRDDLVFPKPPLTPTKRTRIDGTAVTLSIG
jgi:hypothetical protein